MRGSVIEASVLARRAFLVHFSASGLLFALTARAAVAQVGPAPRRVLVVGDSLSAEYGLRRGTGWVALLAARLAREGVAATVINASISGDTTSGGRARLPALLAQHKPAVVVLELGGNDALRGLPLASTQANLAEMARAAKAAGARVLIAGMAVPPNYGRQYGEDFVALFATVAKAEGAALVTVRTPTPCFRLTASIRRLKPTPACWPMSGRCCGLCCAEISAGGLQRWL